MILAVISATWEIVREGPEKFRAEQFSNPDHCNVSALLYQLSYQPNWGMADIWVHEKSVNGVYVVV